MIDTWDHDVSTTWKLHWFIRDFSLRIMCCAPKEQQLNAMQAEPRSTQLKTQSHVPTLFTVTALSWEGLLHGTPCSLGISIRVAMTFVNGLMIMWHDF